MARWKRTRLLQYVRRPRPGLSTTLDTSAAYIAFGANLGDREHTFQQVVATLPQRGFTLEASSPLYETAPVGGPTQPNYLNAVLHCHTTLAPLDMLSALQALEAEHGRVRDPAERWGPRPLDLDLLFIDQLQLQEKGPPSLELPHPRLHLRRFILVPLHDIAPSLIHPTLGESIATLLEACPDTSPVLPYNQGK